MRSFLTEYKSKAWCLLLPGFLGLVGIGWNWVQEKKIQWYANSALIGITLFSQVLCMGVNYYFSGNAEVGRASYAHSFLAGITEIPNPYTLERQLDGTDQSIVDFFGREHQGEEIFSRNAKTSPEYNRWSREKMREFIRQYPVLYVRIILKRIVRILFPNFRITFFADTDAVNQFEDPNSRVKRLEIIHGRSLLTWSRLSQLYRINSLYFFEFLVRTCLMFFLPMGWIFFFAFRFRQKKLEFCQVATLFPLVYICGLVGWIMLPRFDHAGPWSVALTGSVSGWGLAIQSTLRAIRRMGESIIGNH